MTGTRAGPSVSERPVRRGIRYSRRRKIGELAALCGGLAVLICVCPLNSRYSHYFSISVGVLTLAYLTYGLWTVPGVAKRWGFVFQARREEGIARGMAGMIVLGAAALVPIVFLRKVVGAGYGDDPSAYFLWCFVQDFLFFSLGLRNLLDFCNRHAAVLCAAVLFGLSHYPFGPFMLVTAAAGVCWGYVFAWSRVLWFVTALHAVHGLLLLA
jgi:membrane protease YdiL (CAAX protease family)